MTGEVIALVVLSAVWVFFDAPLHGGSRTWALGVLALWIIAFPLYLVERRRNFTHGRSVRGQYQRLGHPPPSPETRRAVPPPPPAAPAQWYPDPFGREVYRYWDGSGWTEHTSAGSTTPSR